ncbi:MAG: stage V sporulation protein S [Pelagibacterales bacterium]|nr:stage V sporulation protein S [Pelagibacterales bacterium]
MSDDETNILKIRGGSSSDNREESKEYVKRVARAILAVISKHGEARLKAVGAPSVNNAVKSFIIARSMASDSDSDADLLCTASFDVANFGGQEKTAIMFTVFPDEYEEE